MELEEAVKLLGEFLLHDAKAGNIETLESMGAVRRVAKDNNVTFLSCVEKALGAMRAVPIDEKGTLPSACLLSSRRIKVVDQPVNSDVAIDPAILRT